MSEESLAERMRKLRIREAEEADADAIGRALHQKASLAERMKGLGDGAVPEPDADAQSAPYEPTPGVPEAIAEVFLAAKSSGLAERMKALAGDTPETPADEPDEVVAEAEEPGEKSRKQQLTDWFLGKQVQEKSGEQVTPILPLPEGWVEKAFYPVEAPFSFIRIRENSANGDMLYEAMEPPLTDKETRILEFVHDALVRGLNVNPDDLNNEARQEILERAVRQIIADYRIRVTDVSQQRIEYYVVRDFIGLGPIQPLMIDPNIEDISCDGPDLGLFVYHREFDSIQSNVLFHHDADLDAYVIRLAQRSGKAISISDPILDAALPDGSRLQATLGQEVTQNGSTFTIRRFKPDPFTPIDLVRFGSMSKELLAYFWLIVENGSSLVFSGGTASGKTTGLNAISQFIPPQAKIVSIEDTREVNLPHKNWIKSMTRSGSTSEGTGEIGMFELLKASLRQRPEYILVGEVRGVEASVAFQAMATGHTVYSTMHADSARSVVYRLENEPINIPRLVMQALDVIAIQGQVRYQGKRVRRVKEVVELVGMDPQTRELLTHTAFTWDNKTDTFSYAGRSYLLEQVADARNWGAGVLKEEMTDRIHVIEWMLAQNFDRMEQVTEVIHQYYRDKSLVLARLEEKA